MKASKAKQLTKTVMNEALMQIGQHFIHVCDNELKWFSSYLNDRLQVCYVNGQTSAPKIIVNGILLGSILGPLLFLLYINDLADNLEKSTPFMGTTHKSPHFLMISIP